MAPRSAAAATGEWQNRIEKLTLVAPDQLLAHPLNARRHDGAQRDVIRSSLDGLGWVAPVIVNTTTGRMIDGHARTEEALTRGVPKVPVLYVTLTEEEELVALASYDPITAMASYDGHVLGMLLEEIDLGSLDAPLGDLLGDLSDDHPDKGQPVVSDATGPTPGERQEAYEGSDIRSLVLPFSLLDFERTVDLLDAARKRYGVDSNSAAVLRALEAG